MPDWLEPTFTLLPLAAWMFLGVGVPWALALLPRADWRDWPTVLAVGMALGPIGVTTIMFMQGTFAHFAPGVTLAISGALAALGAALAMRQTRSKPTETPIARPVEAASLPQAPRLTRAGRLIIAGIVLLVLLNVVITAYWPFIAYDTQWVYGYNARIFMLRDHIPSDMGYYPQLVPLSYTLMQQVWGSINDHAARVVVPWFNLATILMVYALGKRLFQQRAGLLAAGIWAFYPHVAAWSGAGDLEITLTLYTTGAALFFIQGWQTGQARYALLSGLLLSGALWTKPTGGAPALGVMLAVAGWAIWVRLDPARLWPRLRIAIIAGLATIPIGSMWYLRNLSYDHVAVVFPPSYWHDFAQRSGQEFGWLLLIALLIAGYLRIITQRCPALMALGLLLVGILPGALNLDSIKEVYDVWRWVRGDLGAAHRLDWLEYGLIAAGFGLLAWQSRAAWSRLAAPQRSTLLLVWALLLPYGLVWYWNFSYHYRLSFAIVPLFVVQVAALIDGWLWDWLAARRGGRIAGTTLIGVMIALAASTAVEHSAQEWKHGGLPDDTTKYDQGNPGLMVVVHMLERYAAENSTPVVAIHGEDRLPFFFPEWEIRNSRDPEDLPSRFEDLEGVDVYIDNSPGEFITQQAGLWPNSLSADVAVAEAYHTLSITGPKGAPWPTVLEPIPLNPDGSLTVDDGNFWYTAFTLNPNARHTPMQPVAPAESETLFGDFAQFLGHDVVSLDWYRGEKIRLALYWRPTENAPPAQDYSIYVHLLSPDGKLLAQWDGEPMQNAYPTRFWRPGESLYDYWVLRIPPETATGPAELRIGIYDPLANERLPVTVDGVPAGDGLTINTRITVR